MKPGAVPRALVAGGRIRKRVQDLAVEPRLRDRDAACQAFSWDAVRRDLGVGPEGSLNLARLVLDRHADGPRGGRVAVRWLGADGRSQRISYRELRERSHRFANAFAAAGVQRGETLFLLIPRLPALVAALLGALEAGLVVAPLHPLLGRELLAQRLAQGGCRALLTTAALCRSSVAPLRSSLPALEHVLLVEDGAAGAAADLPQGAVDLEPLLRQASMQFPATPTAPDALALLHFTGGASGPPKGVLHAHQAALSLWLTGLLALDLRAGDVFWCTADPGDFGGLSWGLIAPLLHGVTLVIDESGIEAAHCYDVLQRQGVTVWCTTPTAIRSLMHAGPALAARHRLPRLRLVTSFGERLDEQAVWWSLETLGLPIHDQWGQTECGALMIANTPALDIKPGAMGLPLPGVDACVVLRRPEGGVELLQTPEAEGELALRSGWPSMFRGYLAEPAAYRECFVDSAAGELYLTGDLVRRDAEGYHWFAGTAQDRIRSAGHAIAPHEVEAALLAHPDVAEAAVVGRPDPVLGEAVVAFVTLRPGCAASAALRAELLADALQRLGPLAAPRTLEFASQLPHTRDGRLMRRLVRALALDLADRDDGAPLAGAPA